MRECPKCGNFIPRDAGNICPHCSKWSAGIREFILGIALLVAFVFIAFFIWNLRNTGFNWRGLFTFFIILSSALIGIFFVCTGYSHLSLRVRKYRIHTSHDFIGSCYCKVCGKLKAHTWDGYNCMVCGVYHPSLAKLISEIEQLSYPMKSDAHNGKIIEMAKKHFPWNEVNLSLNVKELSREDHCSGEPIYAMWETVIEEFSAVLYIDGKVADCYALGKTRRDEGDSHTSGSGYQIIE